MHYNQKFVLVSLIYKYLHILPTSVCLKGHAYSQHYVLQQSWENLPILLHLCFLISEQLKCDGKKDKERIKSKMNFIFWSLAQPQSGSQKSYQVVRSLVRCYFYYVLECLERPKVIAMQGHKFESILQQNHKQALHIEGKFPQVPLVPLQPLPQVPPRPPELNCKSIGSQERKKKKKSLQNNQFSVLIFEVSN